MKLKKLAVIIPLLSLGLISSHSIASSVPSWKVEHEGSYMDSKKTKQLIMFVNGIQNTIPNAQDSAEKLAETLGFDKNNPQYSYGYFYNPKSPKGDSWYATVNSGQSFLGDNLELEVQAIYSDNALKEAGVSNPDKMTEKQKQAYYYELGKKYSYLINNIDSIDKATLRNIAITTKRLASSIESKLTPSIVNEPFETLILVPHSQGNFFVESAYAYLYYQEKQELLERVRVVGVASVATSTPNDTYLNSPLDKAVYVGQGNQYWLTKTKLYHPLPANTDICISRSKCNKNNNFMDNVSIEQTIQDNDMAGHGFDNIYLNPSFMNDRGDKFPNIIKDYVLNFNKVLKERYVDRFYESLDFSTGRAYVGIPTDISLKIKNSDKLQAVKVEIQGKIHKFSYLRSTDTWVLPNIIFDDKKPVTSVTFAKIYKGANSVFEPTVVTEFISIVPTQPRESAGEIDISFPESAVVNTNYDYSIKLNSKNVCVDFYSIDWGDGTSTTKKGKCLDLAKIPPHQFDNVGTAKVVIILGTDKNYLLQRKTVVVTDNTPLPQPKIIPTPPIVGKDFYIKLVGGDLSKIVKAVVRYDKETKVLIKKQISSKITVNSNKSSLPITISYYDRFSKKVGEVVKTVKLQTSKEETSSNKSKLTATGITKCGNYPYDKDGNKIQAFTNDNDLNCDLNYDSKGYSIPAGQDGHFQAGQKMSYTLLKRNGEECVKDNVTGLIWEQKTDDGGLRDKDNSYTWYNPDPKTNDGNTGVQDGGKCTGSKCDTQAYIQALNNANYCGYSDWRIPTRSELISIIDYRRFNPAINPIFSNTQNSNYWANSPNIEGRDNKWYLSFNVGISENGDSLSFVDGTHIRAVRTKAQNYKPTLSTHRFTIINNGTEVKDNKTGLIWQRCSLGQTLSGNKCVGTAKEYNWKNALSKAQALGNGYRLPNIKELQSLIEGNFNNSAINSKMFPNTPINSVYLSASTTSYHSPGVWFLWFDDGYSSYTEKNNNGYVRPVRSE